MTARRDPGARPRPDRDTLADDCVMDFLGDLGESLWILADLQRSPANDFGQAARKQDHINELRRILYRLHQVLVEWEEA